MRLLASARHKTLNKDAGVNRGLSHNGCRTFARDLLANGPSIDTIQILLGHAEIDHVMPYLTVQQNKLKAMFSEEL